MGAPVFHTPPSSVRHTTTVNCLKRIQDHVTDGESHKSTAKLFFSNYQVFLFVINLHIGYSTYIGKIQQDFSCEISLRFHKPCSALSDL